MGDKHTPCRPRAGGFTLIEAMVALGIVGLLAALLAPAIQQSREAARRSACVRQLHQIGMAVQHYHAAFDAFPSVVGATWRTRDPRDSVGKAYSLFTQVLPQLDQGPLFHALNFEVGWGDPYLDPTRSSSYATLCNFTVHATRLAVALCPSDGGRGLPGWTAGTNYRANLGTDRWHYSSDGPFSDFIRTRTAASVTDGLSQTVAFAEKLRGGLGAPELDLRRTMIVGGLGAPFTNEESLASCLSRRGAPDGRYDFGGLCWSVGTLAHSCYNHVVEPNSTVADCVLANAGVGIVGARSNHPGGINAAFADGSVRFVRNSITRPVWRALGSGTGGEVVDAGGM